MPADIALTIFNLKKINCRPIHVKKHKRKKNSYLCTRFPLITYYLLLTTYYLKKCG